MWHCPARTCAGSKCRFCSAGPDCVGTPGSGCTRSERKPGGQMVGGSACLAQALPTWEPCPSMGWMQTSHPRRSHGTASPLQPHLSPVLGLRRAPGSGTETALPPRKQACPKQLGGEVGRRSLALPCSMDITGCQPFWPGSSTSAGPMWGSVTLGVAGTGWGVRAPSWASSGCHPSGSGLGWGGRVRGHTVPGGARPAGGAGVPRLPRPARQQTELPPAETLLEEM